MSRTRKAQFSIGLFFFLLVAGCLLLTGFQQTNLPGSYGGGAVTNPVLAPDGTAALPAYGFSSTAGLGWYRSGNTIVASSQSFNTFKTFSVTSAAFNITGANGALGWSSANDISGNMDTSLCRAAAGVVEAGSGAACATSGAFKGAAYMSVGTTFTSNAGCTEGTLVGGATAGKFTVGQNTACTIVITMGNAATSPNGWACTAYDQTAVPAVAIRQTASNATTASFLMTVAISDVITFNCTGY